MEITRKFNEYHIEMPEFRYLDRFYNGDYIYREKNNYFYVKITFDNESYNIYKFYDAINTLTLLNIYNILYHTETATVRFECFGRKYNIVIPVQLLDIVDKNTNLRLILRPDIKTFSSYLSEENDCIHIVLEINITNSYNLVKKLLNFFLKKHKKSIEE